MTNYKLHRLEDLLETVERLAGVRGGTYLHKQRADGSWPKLPKHLSADTLVIDLLSFGHDKVAISKPPYFRPGTDPAAHADYLQRRTAIATGKQIPINGDLADR